MVAGTAVGAVGAYGFHLLGGRALGAVEFAPITMLWTVQVLVLMVALVPVEQLVIRRLELTGGRSAGLRASSPSLFAAVAVATVTVTGLAWLSRDRFLAGEPIYVVVCGLLVLGYSVFAVGRGYLAGRHRYRAYGLATAAEALLRLALTGCAVLVAPAGVWLAWAMAAAPFAVLLLRPFRAVVGDSDVSLAPLGGLGGFLGPLLYANALSQAVLASGPLVAGALGATPAVVSIVFITFTLFRGPLWVVQSALARVLPPFTALAARGDHDLLRAWSARLALGGVVTAGLAWAGGLWLGPGVVALLFGAQFRPSATLSALAISGTVLAAAVLGATQILVALDRTTRIAVAWTCAAGVSVAVTLLTPGDPTVRVGLGFVAGELTALVGLTRARWVA